MQRLAVLLLLSASPSQAVTKNWVGPNNGDWNAGANWDPSGVPGASADVVLNASNTVSLNGAATINSLRIHAGSKLTHPAGASNKLDLTIAGDFTLDSGGSIDVNGKGTPGTGSLGGGGHAGAGQGGYTSVLNGSYCYNVSYSYPAGGPETDFYIEPALPGGAGAVAGGGVVLLRVGGTATVNGEILADGSSISSSGGGGAGGTVNIHTSSFTGIGTLRVNGGSGGVTYVARTCQYYTIIGYQTQNTVDTYRGGNGAGGRIAIWAPETTFTGAAGGGTVFHHLDRRSSYLEAVDRTSLKVDWTADAVGPRYILRLATDPNIGSVVGSFDITRTTASFTGLTPRTTYFLQIEGLRFTPNPAPLVAFYVVTRATEPQSGNISGVTQTSFNLFWNSGGNGSGTGYLAEISTHSDFSPIYGSSVTENTRAGFSGLEGIATYYARVAAIESDGALTAYATAQMYIPNLTTPAPLSLDGVAPKSVQLGWAVQSPPNPEGTRFEVKQLDGPGGSVLLSTATTAYAMNFGAGGVGSVVPNTTYYFTMKATHTFFSYSTTTVTVATVTPSAAPEDASIDVISRDILKFQWTTAGNPTYTRYVAEISTHADFSFIADSSETLIASRLYTGLESSTRYYLRVAALNHDGNRSAYVEASAQTPAVSQPLLYTGAVPTAVSGTKGLWHFDDGTGTTAQDYSGSSHHGTLQNMTNANWVLGKSGTALSFDGSSGYVQVPDSVDFEFTDYTLEAWVKTTYTGGQRVISQQDNSGRYWALRLDNGLQVCDSRDVGCPVYGSADLYADGNWHHVAVTRTNGEFYRFFIDRKQVGTQGAGNVSSHDIADVVTIGAYNIGGGVGEYFNGLIDEARILNVALPPDEVTGVSTTSIVLNWTVPGNPNPEGTVYEVSLSISPGFEAVLASSSTTGFVLDFGEGGLGSLAPNTTYYFGVTASSLGFTTARVTLAAPTLANPPLNTAVTTIEDFGFTLSWDANGNGDQTLYLFEVAADEAFTQIEGAGSVRATTVSTRSSFVINDNTTHFSRVRAVHHGGTYTLFDSTVTVLTLAATPTKIYFEDVSSHSLVASAYAPNPGFSNLGQGPSALNFAILSGGDSVYQGWRQGGGWSTKLPMPTARGEQAAAALNGKIHVVGGWYTSGYGSPTHVVYDPGTDTWATKQDMGTARSYGFGAVALQGKVNVMGGWEGYSASNVTASHESYDPSTDRWSTDVPLPAPRGYNDAVAYQGKIYHVGGQNQGGTDLSDLVVYDPGTRVWSFRASMPTPLNYGQTLAEAGGRLFAFSSGKNYVYDIAADTWSVKTPEPNSPQYAAAAALGGKLYLFGDYTYVYDPELDSWKSLPTPPNDHYGTTVAQAVRGKLYVIGGYNNYTANDEFDPGVSVPFTGLSPNAVYSFRAKARNSAGTETAESGAFSVFTLAAPPAGLQVVAVTSTSVSVAWDAGGNPDGTRYECSASADGFQTTPTAVASVSRTQAAFTGLTPGTAYSVRVRARNGDGIATEFAPMVTATTRILPASPVSIGISSIAWSWDPVPGASYLLFAASDTQPTREIGSASSPAFVWTGLSTNTAYGLVLVVNRQGVVDLSDAATAYTLAAAPANVRASTATAGSVTLAWDGNGNPAGTPYEVRLSLDNVFFSRVVSFEDGLTTTTYILGQLSPSTTYYVRIRAENGAGALTAFADGTVQTAAAAAGGGGGGGGGGGASPITDAPTGMTAAETGTDYVNWVWTSVFGATGYNVYRATSGALLAAVPTNSLLQTGLTPNTPYGLRVRAENSLGEGPLSFSATAYTLAALPAAPDFTGVFVTSLTFAWTANQNPAGTLYVGELARSADFESLTASSQTRNVTWTATGLELGTTYYLRVKARNGRNVDTEYAAAVSTATKRPEAVASARPPGESVVVEFVPPAGLVRVSIPAGTFREAYAVTVRLPSSLPAAVSRIQDLKATGVGVEIEIDKPLQPSLPVTLEIGYRDSDVAGLDEGRLVVARYVPSAGTWLSLRSTVDAAANTVTGITDHLSTFQVMQASPADSVSQVKVFPNPFQPSAGHSAMTFSRLPAGSRIRIYSLVGEFIRELATDAFGLALWDGRNSSGAKAGSGVYFVLIEGTGGRKTVKLAIER